MMEFIQSYVGSPTLALLTVALGITAQAIMLHWACTLFIKKHITFLRAGTIVMCLGLANAVAAIVLEDYGVNVKSMHGICGSIAFSTAVLSALLPTDPVNAFLILLISVGLTSVTAMVFGLAGAALMLPTIS